MADATHQLDSRKDPDPVDVETKSKYAYCLHTSQFFSLQGGGGYLPRKAASHAIVLEHRLYC
jgi:hypothetical protein